MNKAGMCGAKVSETSPYKQTFSGFSLVESEPPWLPLEDVKFEAGKVLALYNY